MATQASNGNAQGRVANVPRHEQFPDACCDVITLLGDPHGLEGGEGSEDGSSDPDGVFPLWWGDDLDLHGGRGEGGDLLLHAVGDTGEHGGATGQDGVGVQVLKVKGMMELQDSCDQNMVDKNGI